MIKKSVNKIFLLPIVGNSDRKFLKVKEREHKYVMYVCVCVCVCLVMLESYVCVSECVICVELKEIVLTRMVSKRKMP